MSIEIKNKDQAKERVIEGLETFFDNVEVECDRCPRGASIPLCSPCYDAAIEEATEEGFERGKKEGYDEAMREVENQNKKGDE